MKKLTKQNLDELAATMNIVPGDEQRGYMGQYSNDCFWRCVAYIREGDGSSAMAEIYARSYYSRMYEVSIYQAHATLHDYGSGVTLSDIQNFIRQSVSDGTYTSGSPRGYIGYFHNTQITDYNVPGASGAHAVVIGHMSNSDGSYNYFDYQNNTGGTISASEMQYVTRAMY